MDDTGNLPTVAIARGIPSPQKMKELYDFAQLIAKSGLAPRDLQSPEKVAVAILYGNELGLSPMMALQRIAVINGRPCLWGDAVPAVIMASGELEVFEEWFEDEPAPGEPLPDTMTAYCKVKRRGRRERTARFSVWDAKVAGLWDKRGRDGQPTPWQTYPKRMLQMRARVALRDEFPDKLAGLYLAEELIGNEPEIKDVTPKAPKEAPRVPDTPQGRNRSDGDKVEGGSGTGAQARPLTIPRVPAAPPRQGSTAPVEAKAVPVREEGGQRAPEPASNPEPSNDALDGEVLPPEPLPGRMSEWRGRLDSADYDEAVNIIEREVYPAHEAGEISEAEKEELIEQVMSKSSWRR